MNRRNLLAMIGLAPVLATARTAEIDRRNREVTTLHDKIQSLVDADAARSAMFAEKYRDLVNANHTVSKAMYDAAVVAHRTAS